MEKDKFPTKVNPHRFGEGPLRVMITDAPLKEVRRFKK